MLARSAWRNQRRKTNKHLHTLLTLLHTTDRNHEKTLINLANFARKCVLAQNEEKRDQQRIEISGLKVALFEYNS